MAGAHVEFTGDASGAASAAAAAQAAIDSVHGKTETVTINVRVNQTGNINDAAAAMGRHADASERAARGAREHERASSRAAASVRAHADASERAGGAVGGLGDGAGRAAGGLNRVGGSADRAGGSVGGFGRQSDRAGRSTSSLGGSAGKLGDALTDLGTSAGGATRGLAGAMGGARAITGTMGVAATAVQGFGMAAAYATAGSAILTAGVGAVGAVGVGALTGVGVAAGVAGGAMASFAIDAHKDSARFGADMKQLGQAAHLGAQAVSEPMAAAMVGLGRSMVGADGQLTSAGAGIVSSLQSGFGTAAGVVDRSSGAIAEAAGIAARGFDTMTAQAAPGVEAFLGSMPSLAHGAVSAMSQVTSEFGASAGAIEGATPAINRAMGSVGGLTAQLVRTGAASSVPFFENVGSMADGLSQMTSDLGPAIKPSMQAVTDTVNAASGGIGSLAPDIAGFAGTLSANAPQMESIVGSLGKGMLSFGSAAVDGLGMAAPAIADLAGSLQANQGGIASMVGGIVGGAAWVGARAADVIGAGASIDSAVKSAIPPGGLKNAITGEGPQGGVASPGVALGDAARKMVGMGPSGMGAKSPFGPGEFLSKGGGFDQISQSGGLMGAYGRAVSEMGGARATPQSDAAMGAASRAAAPGSPPLAAPSPTAAVMGAAAAPMPSGVGGLFTGAAQSAQQGAAAIPAAMQSAMSQSRQAVSGANLGGAMQAPMRAMTGAIAGSNVGGSMGGQMQQMTKTVQSSAGSAASAGGKVGGAIGAGVAKGTSSSTTVVDEIMINRITKVKESAMGAMNAKSPSRDFEKIGRFVPQGFDQGVVKGLRASRAGGEMAADIAARGRQAMAASSSSFASQQAQVDADRTMMQSLKIGVGGAGRAATAGLDRGPGEALKGAEKRAAFGEDANYKGTRMVFDKQVMSWNAKPGEKIGIDSDGMWSGIESPLSAKQQGAMEAMQGSLDKGRGGSYGMFGERTQQNILRNRPGAFAVAGAISDYESRAKQQQGGVQSDRYQEEVKKQPKYTPVDITPGGSGAGGQSYLGRDRINMVRQAAGLGKDVGAGYGQGLASSQSAAVAPMGRLAAAQQKRYREDWGISSPSTVAAGMSGDIVAGSAAGLVGNAGMATGAMGQVSDAMQAVASDRGLQVGLTYSENVLTGASQVLKKADYQATGLPRLESLAAMTALAGTGVLKAGSGASIVKTVGNTPSIVTLGGAQRPIQVTIQPQHIYLDGERIVTIADERVMVGLDKIRDHYEAAAR